MKSPRHRSNLLDPEYQDIGIGVLPVEGRIIVAQVFGVEQEEYFNAPEKLSPKQDMVFLSMFFWFLAGCTILLLFIQMLRSRRR